VIASPRQGRTFLPPADECPLDPSRDGRQTEIPAEDYEVVVFENRFPSLDTAALLGPDPDDLADDDPLFTRQAGVGRCEVVCFTSDHSAAFASLPPERVDTVFDAWVDRTRDLNAMPEVEQVFVFENRGEEIGVTLSHPHGQIYAYPFVPPRMRRQLESARRYRERTGECLHCVLLAAERRAGTRIVADNDLVTVVVPHAARWPYEAHVYPRRHVPDLPALTGEERAAVARAYLGPPAAVRPPVPDADAVHRRLDAGAGPQRPRADAPARRGVLDPPCCRQAEVPAASPGPSSGSTTSARRARPRRCAARPARCTRPGRW
jgi:galactose-1-phosphate uridylyltransferase, family 1